MGFKTRHLGSVQLPTDQAVIFTKKIIDEKIRLDDIPKVDYPTIQLRKKEAVDMPFRYLADDHGKPVLAPGMLQVLKNQNDMSLN